MMRKATSLFLAVGLALAGLPVGAAQGLPNSISGKVPAGIEGVANAVLQDASGKNLSMAPVTDGRFTFRNIAPGEYYVALFGLGSTLGMAAISGVAGASLSRTAVEGRAAAALALASGVISLGLGLVWARAPLSALLRS